MLKPYFRWTLRCFLNVDTFVTLATHILAILSLEYIDYALEKVGLFIIGCDQFWIAV